MQAIEARYGQPVETLLNDLYHSQGLTQTDIAQRWGVSNTIVSRWMRWLGIETRVFGPDRLVEGQGVPQPANGTDDSHAEQAERRSVPNGVLAGSG